MFRTINLIELEDVCKNIKNKPDFNNVSINVILYNWNNVGNIIPNIVKVGKYQ